jgi:hypothetical protein
VTYHAVDRAGTASPSVSDNVRVFASESIVPSKWQYTTAQNRWVVTGTVSPNQAQTMTITYASGSYNVWNTAQSKFACTGNPTGQLIGKAVTDTTATWTLDQGGTNPNSILNPTNSNNNAVSPDGRTKTSFWCTTPTLRITSSATGASVTTSAVQIK